MPLSGLLLDVVVGAVAYYCAWFVIHAHMIDDTRARLHQWLKGGNPPSIKMNAVTQEMEFDVPWWKKKLLQWVSCPYCQTPYYSAALLLGVRLFSDTTVPLPVLSWLASVTFALGFWRLIQQD